MPIEGGGPVVLDLEHAMLYIIALAAFFSRHTTASLVTIKTTKVKYVKVDVGEDAATRTPWFSPLYRIISYHMETRLTEAQRWDAEGVLALLQPAGGIDYQDPESFAACRFATKNEVRQRPQFKFMGEDGNGKQIPAGDVQAMMSVLAPLLRTVVEDGRVGNHRVCRHLIWRQRLVDKDGKVQVGHFAEGTVACSAHMEDEQVEELVDDEAGYLERLFALPEDIPAIVLGAEKMAAKAIVEGEGGQEDEEEGGADGEDDGDSAHAGLVSGSGKKGKGKAASRKRKAAQPAVPKTVKKRKVATLSEEAVALRRSQRAQASSSSTRPVDEGEEEEEEAEDLMDVDE
ncbi:hypothetical protein BCR44DRAFT_88644 [Catenaria anguillulae PL171]|uniref:Uncharacterized protein n=1 Tax=Catenaria anguillulae PL171 TaxID=765915 RepID=A0A1Y2HRA6_9FUNG|nr:hypothetical protein BCR44DRAFT_88644 [Catenaria anguillulae PL171]